MAKGIIYVMSSTALDGVVKIGIISDNNMINVLLFEKAKLI